MKQNFRQRLSDHYDIYSLINYLCHTQVLASFLRRMKHKSPRPSLHNRTTSGVSRKNITISNHQISIQNHQIVQDKTVAAENDVNSVPRKRKKCRCAIL